MLDLERDKVSESIYGYKEVHLIDFGRAKRYLDANGAHLEDQTTYNNYNIWFASKHSFYNHTLSRRDDIISLIYNLVFL